MGPRDWEHSIGIGLESVFGQEAAPSVWVPGECKLKKSPGLRELNRPMGEWDESRVTVGPTRVRGSMTLEVAPGRESVIEMMLRRRTTGANAHRVMNSFTVWEVLGPADNPIDCFVNTGISLNKGNFKVASGEDLTLEGDFIGRARYRKSPPRPAFNSPPAPYVFEEMLCQVRGANEYHLETVNTEFDHQLKDDDYGSDGTGLLRSIPSDGRKITQKFDHAYEHPELWDLAMARVPFSTVLRFVRGNYYFSITLPLLYSFEADIDGNKQPLEMQARKPQNSEIVLFDYVGRAA